MRIPKGINVGYTFPDYVHKQKSDGKYGNHIHEKLDKIHNTNKTKGADLPEHGIEVKTKDTGTKTKTTIGTFTAMEADSVDTIFNNANHIIDKLQELVIYYHNRIEVVAIRNYDLRSVSYQVQIRNELYDIAGKISTNNVRSTNGYDYIETSAFHVEREHCTNTWRVRLDDNRLQMAKDANHFDSIFEVSL